MFQVTEKIINIKMGNWSLSAEDLDKQFLTKTIY